MTMQHIHVANGVVLPGGSAGVRYGDCIAVAGQVAVDESGMIVGEGDVRAQAEQCFRNIEQILAQAGACLSDIVMLTGYLRNLDDASAYLAVRTEKFGENAPATTTVIAAPLHPSLLIEIQVVAYKPKA